MQRKFRLTLLALVVLLQLANASVNWGDEPLRPSPNDDLPTQPHSPDIALDKQSIQAFLQAITDSKNDSTEVKKLILELGANYFSIRQDAEAALSKLPVVPIDLLEAAAQSKDPEIALRATRILLDALPKSKARIEASLRAIESQKTPGLTNEICKTAVKFQDQPSIVIAARNALVATASSNDIAYLSTKMNVTASELERDIALQALRRLEDASLADSFARWALLDQFSEAIRLESALALADLGDRRALTLLAGMMVNAKSPSIRGNTQYNLKKLTGQSFIFSYYAELSERTKQAESWNKWIATDGQTARLNFPLRRILNASFFENLTLLAQSDPNKVIALDETHKEVWSYECKYPVSVEKMINGNLLIAAYGNNRVIEVNPEKVIVRQHNLESVACAKPLENGNFLCTCYYRRGVFEINTDGKTVWSYAVGGESAEEAIRLGNGNTLVTHHQTVVEIDPAGKLIWEFKTADKSISNIRALPNDHVLIALLVGTVLEVDRKTNQIVWQLDVDKLRDAHRLPNGNTLILTDTRALEVDRNGNEFWEKTDLNYGTITQ